MGKDEVKVQTKNGSLVEIEFSPDGNFEEASGDNCKADVFIPKRGLLSLKEVHEALIKLGKVPEGEWSLEESFLQGWHYDFEGSESAQEVEYVMDANNGKLLKTKK